MILLLLNASGWSQRAMASTASALRGPGVIWSKLRVTGTVGAESSLYQFRSVSAQPRPWTQPHTPVLVASESDATFALSARHGLPCMFFLNQNQDEKAVAQLLERHAAVATEHGHHGPWRHTILVYAQVADTDEEAAGVLRGPLRESLRKTAAEYVWLRESWRQRPDRERYLENVIAQHAIGAPATCIDRLAGIVERSGVGRVILVVESAVTPAAALRNVERLGREVLPEVRTRCLAASHVGMGRTGRESSGGNQGSA